MRALILLAGLLAAGCSCTVPTSQIQKDGVEEARAAKREKARTEAEGGPKAERAAQDGVGDP